MEEVISKKESKKHINYKKELEALNEKYLRGLLVKSGFNITLMKKLGRTRKKVRFLVAVARRK